MKLGKRDGLVNWAHWCRPEPSALIIRTDKSGDQSLVEIYHPDFTNTLFSSIHCYQSARLHPLYAQISKFSAEGACYRRYFRRSQHTQLIGAIDQQWYSGMVDLIHFQRSIMNLIYVSATLARKISWQVLNTVHTGTTRQSAWRSRATRARKRVLAKCQIGCPGGQRKLLRETHFQQL